MTMRDIDAITNAIHQSVSSLEVGKALGLNPNRSGFCRCPMHGDHDASMKLYGDQRGWCCFGCHKGGDEIRLVQEVQGCSFWSAVEWLNSAFHLVLPLDQEPDKNASERARIASEHARTIREQERAIDLMLFDCYVMAGQLLNGLEADAKRFRPTRPYGDWPKQFCDAMRNIPEAKELVADLSIVIVGVKENA